MSTWNIQAGVVRRIRTLWKDRRPAAAEQSDAAAPPDYLLRWKKFMDTLLTVLLPHPEARQSLLEAIRADPDVLPVGAS